MHPTDEFAHIRTQIAKLLARAEQQRAGLLADVAPMCSAADVGSFRRQNRPPPAENHDGPAGVQISATKVAHLRAFAPITLEDGPLQLIEE